MTPADSLLNEELKIVADHCRETGLKSGGRAVENAMAELARLRVVVERVEYGIKENLICHRNHTKGVRCIYCQIRDALAVGRKGDGSGEREDGMRKEDVMRLTVGSQEDADRVAEVLNDKVAEIERLTERNSELMEDLEEARAERDALAAENRVILQLVEESHGLFRKACGIAVEAIGRGLSVVDACVIMRRSVETDIGAINRAIKHLDATREVARVEALEQIAQSERSMCEKAEDGRCRRHSEAEEAALDAVKKGEA